MTTFKYIINYCEANIMTTKMEIELTPAQAEKVEILKENGISVGEAVEMLFEAKDAFDSQNENYINAKLDNAQKQKAELENQIAELDKDISVFTKLKDSTLDVEEKAKILDKEYGIGDETYDEAVQDAKHKFKWTTGIFKF